jgi:hypothetical protein
VPTTDPAIDWATSLFASFTYKDGQVVGSYVQFGYDEAYGGRIYSWLARDAWPPLTYFSSLRVEAFVPTGSPSVHGPTFEAPGYLVNVIAHDDPTGLLEVRTEGVSRTVWIDLPPTATNLSHTFTADSWPASRLTYTLGGEQARLILGRGSFAVEGARVAATMSSFDLLLFKMVPARSSQKAEWKAIFDAIGSGAVVAEVGLVARPNGGWMSNRAHYRIDVATTPVDVERRRAFVHVDSPRGEAAVVLLGFDNETMPLGNESRLEVRANGVDVMPVVDTLSLFYAPEAGRDAPMYSVLPLPGTFLAVYLPTLSSVDLEVQSVPPPPPPEYLDAGSQAAMIAALAIVSLAAAVMFRRREE